MVARFAFIIHPIDPKKDVARKFRLLGHMPVSWIDFFSRYFPPTVVSHITGVRSLVGAEAEGWLIAAPYTPRRMLNLPVAEVYRKIARTARVGRRLGAHIVGLGAFTSVVGDAGVTISRQLDIPVTTGNSYTVATVVRTLTSAAESLGIDVQKSTLAVVGATGSIGRACAQYAAQRGGHILAIGRDPDRLAQLTAQMAEQGLGRPEFTTDITELRKADLVITAAGSPRPVVGPEHLGPGAVVCDVALPPNVSPEVRQKRPDVLVLDGGLTRVPGTPRLGFNFGLPAGLVYACMAETMILALEKRYESFTLGRNIELAQVEAIDRLAAKHGFGPVGLTYRGHPVSEQDLDAVRRHVARRSPS